MADKKYIPALSLKWLTPFYDAIVEGPISALRMRKDLIAQMGDLNGKRILDVGCGTGTFSILIKERFPTAIATGLDGDPQILEIARKKARDRGLDIQFDHGMSFSLPYPDMSFDVALTSMMLHHLDRDDKQKTAQEMYRVLRPGGWLFGMDFAEPHGSIGRSLRSLTRHFERVADNVDGYLPIMFENVGFKNYTETRRYVFGALAQFQGSK